MRKLAIFASGSGTNAENIIRHFAGHTSICVDAVYCNVPDAYVLTRAKNLGIPAFVFDRKDFNDPYRLLRQLKKRGTDFVVLSGFLWLIPPHFVHAFPRRIVNIHPALLPSYGGKGMYGMNVHRAVIEAGEKESGITIHYIDEHYDQGTTIFQAKCPVQPSDTPESLADRVHALEYAHFPQVIEETVLKSKI